jgi:hypothetical protein
MNQLIKIISKNVQNYPFISMDLKGDVYLSKVSNFVLNENKTIEYYTENTKTIASKTIKDDLFLIDDKLNNILWNYLTIWNGGFNTNAFLSILILLDDMSKNDELKTNVLSIFKQ